MSKKSIEHISCKTKDAIETCIQSCLWVKFGLIFFMTSRGGGYSRQWRHPLPWRQALPSQIHSKELPNPKPKRSLYRAQRGCMPPPMTSAPRVLIKAGFYLKAVLTSLHMANISFSFQATPNPSIYNIIQCLTVLGKFLGILGEILFSILFSILF